MNVVRACLASLFLLLTIGCNSAMPGYRNTGNSGGGGSAGSSVVISSISPNSVSSGAQDFTLTIIGTGFPASPSVRQDHPGVLWSVGGQNGVYLAVDLSQCDATHLTATVPANLVQGPGNFDVQVQIYYFADDTPKAVSNVVKLVVN